VTTRTLNEIAREIEYYWLKPNKTAVPYLEAMKSLNTMEDDCGSDPGAQIVADFLGNATTWRGGVARRIKSELNALLKIHRAARQAQRKPRPCS
jgi:hypothetical protein